MKCPSRSQTYTCPRSGYTGVLTSTLNFKILEILSVLWVIPTPSLHIFLPQTGKVVFSRIRTPLWKFNKKLHSWVENCKRILMFQSACSTQNAYKPTHIRLHGDSTHIRYIITRSLKHASWLMARMSQFCDTRFNRINVRQTDVDQINKSRNGWPY